MNRRIPVLVALALGAGLIGAAGAGDRAAPPGPATFAALRSPTTPYVPLDPVLSTTFFCPGVPAGGDGRGGSVTVTNPTEEAVEGELSVFDQNGNLRRTPLDVPPRSAASVDVGGQIADGFAGMMVELAGQGAMVEQEALLGGTRSVAPCANDTASSWDLPAGSTLDDTYTLLLTNPFPGPAVLAMTLTATSGSRTPTELQAYVVPGHSVRTVELDQIARDQALLAVHVRATRGQVIAGRAQTYGGDEKGTAVTLGGAGGARQWLFADGQIGEGIVERYVIANNGDQPASVDLTFFPATPGTPLTPYSVQVEPGGAVIVDPATLGLGFTGRYGLSVTGAGQASLVVEHEITSGKQGTSVSLGSRFGSPRWWAPIGGSGATDGALVVFNASGLDGTVSVATLGPGGAQPLPALTDIPLAAAATITLDLPVEAAGVPVLVSSPELSLVVAQRPVAGEGRRSAALAVPE